MLEFARLPIPERSPYFVEAAKPGTLRLVPPDHRLADLKADYQQMQPMFTEKPPPFDEILHQLAQIEETLNKGIAEE